MHLSLRSSSIYFTGQMLTLTCLSFVMLGEIGPSEIFTEFVEVIIHNILYARKVYPDTIYSPRRKYGIPVFQCIQPDVNHYIAEALKAVSFHYKRNQLKQLLLCFESEGLVVERYVFNVVDIKNFVNSDPLILKLEQYMRDFLLRLHSSLSYLNELAESTTFSIRLEVTEYSSWEFNQDPNHESFPWIHLTEMKNTDSFEIVPVHSVNSDILKLQIYLETPSS